MDSTYPSADLFLNLLSGNHHQEIEHPNFGEGQDTGQGHHLVKGFCLVGIDPQLLLKGQGIKRPVAQARALQALLEALEVFLGH